MKQHYSSAFDIAILFEVGNGEPEPDDKRFTLTSLSLPRRWLHRSRKQWHPITHSFWIKLWKPDMVLKCGSIITWTRLAITQHRSEQFSSESWKQNRNMLKIDSLTWKINIIQSVETTFFFFKLIKESEKLNQHGRFLHLLSDYIYFILLNIVRIHYAKK